MYEKIHHIYNIIYNIYIYVCVCIHVFIELENAHICFVYNKNYIYMHKCVMSE